MITEERVETPTQTRMSDSQLIREAEEIAGIKPQKVITSKPRTYEVGRELGRGTWGRVFAATDQFGEQVAIKKLDPTDIALEQMQHRNQDLWRVINNEAMTLAQSACANVVPRRIEVGETGEPYIVMPQYKKFLSEVLKERDYYGPQSNLERLLRLSRNISKGLAEIHVNLKRPYGDLKPDNVAIDEEGNALINDLGTASMGRSISPRDNMGFEGTRAPEDWKEGGKIDKRSDVYSFGSLLYNFFSKNYINEEVDPLDPKADNKRWTVIKQNVPKQLRKFVRKCTYSDPEKRYQDAVEMNAALEKALEEFSISKHVKRSKPWAWTALAVAAFASLAYYRTATYEPQKLSMPVVMEGGKTPGLLYLNENDKKKVVFDAETIVDLPQLSPARGMMTEGIDRIAKSTTDNRIVAYLTKANAYAFWSKGQWVEPLSDFQEKIYPRLVGGEEAMREKALHGPVYPVIAKTIEYAMGKSLRPDGKVDLEDTLAIARLGDGVVKIAKERAGSDNFSRYRYAKFQDGSFVIPEKEQNFIGLWLYYAQNDVDLISEKARKN